MCLIPFSKCTINKICNAVVWKTAKFSSTFTPRVSPSPRMLRRCVTLLSDHVACKTALLKAFYSCHKLLGITAFAQLFFLFVSVPRSHFSSQGRGGSLQQLQLVLFSLSFLPARKRKGSILLSPPSPKNLWIHSWLIPNPTTPGVRTLNLRETAVSNALPFRGIEYLSCKLPRKIRSSFKPETSCVTLSAKKHFLKKIPPPANLWPGAPWRSQAEVWHKLI